MRERLLQKSVNMETSPPQNDYITKRNVNLLLTVTVCRIISQANVWWKGKVWEGYVATTSTCKPWHTPYFHIKEQSVLTVRL